MSLSPACKEAGRLIQEIAFKMPAAGNDAAAALLAVRDLPSLEALSRLASACKTEALIRRRDEHYELLAGLPIGTPLHLEAAKGYRLDRLADGALVKVFTPARVVYLRQVKTNGRTHVGLWTSSSMDDKPRTWKWWKREWCEQLATKPWPKPEPKS